MNFVLHPQTDPSPASKCRESQGCVQTALSQNNKKAASDVLGVFYSQDHNSGQSLELDTSARRGVLC